MWLSPDWAAIQTAEACTGHIEALRAHGGCTAFPLDCLPHPSTFMPAVNAEIVRRRQQMYQPTTMAFGFGGTTTSTMNFTWGL